MNPARRPDPRPDFGQEAQLRAACRRRVRRDRALGWLLVFSLILAPSLCNFAGDVLAGLLVNR